MLHADSEENFGSFRRAVQKIVPQRMGNLDVIVAGSGIGQLIEGFTAKLKERLDSDQSTAIEDVKHLMERRLPAFYRQVADHPAPDEIKQHEHKFIVAAYSKSDKKYEIWASRSTALVPVTSYELAGVEDVLYDHIAQRMFTPKMTFHQAVLAGLYLFTIAESTSTYIRTPIHVAAVSEAGISMDKQEYIQVMLDHLRCYERDINRVFLACADTSIPVHKLQDILSDFSANAAQMHRDHIDGMMNTLDWKDVMNGGPIIKHPIGVPIGIGSGMRMTVQHDAEKAKQEMQRIKEAREWAESMKKRSKAQKSEDQQ